MKEKISETMKLREIVARCEVLNAHIEPIKGVYHLVC